MCYCGVDCASCRVLRGCLWLETRALIGCIGRVNGTVIPLPHVERDYLPPEVPVSVYTKCKSRNVDILEPLLYSPQLTYYHPSGRLHLSELSKRMQRAAGFAGDPSFWLVISSLKLRNAGASIAVLGVWSWSSFFWGGSVRGDRIR